MPETASGSARLTKSRYSGCGVPGMADKKPTPFAGAGFCLQIFIRPTGPVAPGQTDANTAYFFCCGCLS